MPSKLQVVGIHRKRVSMVVGRRRPSFDRAYVKLVYDGQEMGKLAISDHVYEMMRSNGARILSAKEFK